MIQRLIAKLFNYLTAKSRGFAALFFAILVLVIILAIGLSAAVLTLGQQIISGNITKSFQAYFTAEAGIEDALLRLAEPKIWSSPYTFSVQDSSATVEISNIIGGARTLSSVGDFSDRIRKVQVVYQVSAQEISFYYGVQVGDGGMEMKANARVKGNVFSNGSVIAPSDPDENGFIDNNIVVANNGNGIEGLVVGENASAHTCKDSTINGTLTYVSGGSVINCDAGITIDGGPGEIASQDLPIPQSQIDDWKAEAAADRIITTDYLLDGSGATDSLGPIQVGTVSEPKNLTVNNGANLKITGTIYVAGDILFANNAIIELDSNAYGSTSGIIIADGKIDVNNNAILQGTGEAGSYLLILTTNNSLDPADPALSVGNNAEGAIFYAASGIIRLRNNIEVREVTAYKIWMDNNAEIEYESGLENSLFSGGTGGSWGTTSWKEVE